MGGTRHATGGCACGSIRYVVDGPLRGVYNCHCNWCRRTSGHFTAATQASVDDFALEGDDTLRWWSPNDDDEYGFCSVCGGTVLWRTAVYPGRISIFAGSLDKPTGLSTIGVGFGEYASDYHTIDTTIPKSPSLPGRGADIE